MHDAALKDFDTFLALIRAPGSARAGFLKAIPWFTKYQPSPLWRELPRLNINEDVRRAKAWLLEQLYKPSFPRDKTTGLYFGLDTLNMREGLGKNLEFGCSTKFSRRSGVNDWSFRGGWYGDDTLIKGLFEVSQLVAREDYDIRWFAEYFIWLAYTGLILKQVFKSSPDQLLAGASSRDVLWGHHDGDLFKLGTLTHGGFHVIVSL